MPPASFPSAACGCGAPRAPMRAASADIDVAAAAGVPAWDFSDAVCNAQSCPVFTERERRAVYRESGDLSASFAASLAPAVERGWAATPGLP